MLTAVALRTAAGIEAKVSRSCGNLALDRSGEARAYWETGEPCDKAGAYAIQGLRRGLHRAICKAVIPASWDCRCSKRRRCCKRSRRDRGWQRRMSTEILINASTHEARAAVVENGVLQEVFLERASRRGLISNIYKGRVSRVLPGMQAAFIDIGMERTAFLHASDIFDARARGHRHRSRRVPRTFARWWPKAMKFWCRSSRIRLGTKGARLTTYITLPSRYLVYMPQGRGVGVSARIEEESERERLRAAVQGGLQPQRECRVHRAHRRGGCDRPKPCAPT